MLKKSDTWEFGLKIFKFFGLDEDQSNKNQNPKGGNGLMTIHNPIDLSTKSYQKSTNLKEKWRKLMKFTSKSKYSEVIKLLRQGSAIQEQIWPWLMPNSQKLTQQLYSSKKQQFQKIIYSHHPLIKNIQQINQNIRIPQLQQVLEIKRDRRNSSKQRKFSISKSSAFIKEHGWTNRGSVSINSQASTFSSQHSDEKPLNLDKNGNILFVNSRKTVKNQPADRQMRSSSVSSQKLPLLVENYEPIEILSNFPNQQQQLQNILVLLPQKINHPMISSIIGTLLLHREDFTYSITIFNMTNTFFYYTKFNELKTFFLLSHVASTQFYVHYLSKNWQQTSQLIMYVANRLRKDSPSIAFLDHFRLQNFVENWLYGFFYSVCENGSEEMEKIMGYLLINDFTIESIIKLCQSIIYSLGKIIHQGQQERIYDCLQNPKFYINKNAIFDNLLSE